MEKTDNGLAQLHQPYHFSQASRVLKFIEHAVLSVTFTSVIYVQRLIMLQYLLQWLTFRVFKKELLMYYDQVKEFIILQRRFSTDNQKNSTMYSLTTVAITEGETFCYSLVTSY